MGIQLIFKLNAHLFYSITYLPTVIRKKHVSALSNKKSHFS